MSSNISKEVKKAILELKSECVTLKQISECFKISVYMIKKIWANGSE